MVIQFGPKALPVRPISADYVTVTTMNRKPVTLVQPVAVDIDGKVSFSVSGPGTYRVGIRSPFDTGELYALSVELYDMGTAHEKIDSEVEDLLDDPTSGLSRALSDRWTSSELAEKYGAVGNGTRDDTAAIQAALNTKREVVLLPKTYRITGTLYVRPGCTLRGAGSGNYGQGEDAPTITKIVAAANGTPVAVSVGSRGNISDIMIVAETLPGYTLANYPSGTNNMLTGLELGSNLESGSGSASATRVYVDGFAERGILGRSVSNIERCFVRRTPIGYDLQGSDGWLSFSTAMFCHTAGVKTGGNFWRLVGNRIEWNCRFGIDAAGESTIVANLFDRNGWAGLRLRSGAWGHAVTGNYFCRNGAGGNGTIGRWGFSTPTDPSYVPTTMNQSCHILIDFQRAVTISGNRFRAGGDDSGNGVSSPNFIFSSEAAPGSTGVEHVSAIGNIGLNTGDGQGFGTSTYSANSGAIAGGSDTALATALNRMGRSGLVTRSIGPFATQANVTTVTIPVRKGSSGKITLSANTTSLEGLATVWFTRRTGTTGNGFTAFTNHIGTPVTAAALTGGTPEDTVTITLDVSRFSNYFIEYAN